MEMSPEERLFEYIRGMILPVDDDRLSPFQVRLNRKGINRILVYPGAFNPPHIGHLAFMKDSFTNAGDRNLVCAFVDPCTESFLRDIKFKHTKNALILPYEKRARFWYSDYRFPSWAAVLADSEHGSRSASLMKLKLFAAELGLAIQFTALRGADTCMKNGYETLRSGLAGCTDNILVNTFGRQCLQSDRSSFWNLDQPHWRELQSLDDGVQRYQTDVASSSSAIRGQVRVIHTIKEKPSLISSASLRNLSGMSTDQELAHCDFMLDIVLSWRELQTDSVWSLWQEVESQMRHQEKSESTQQAMEQRIRQIWEVEKAALKKIVDKEEAFVLAGSHAS